MRIKGNSLFGKLVIGLAGIFLLFVFIGCEKDKSVTGHTASITTEANIYNAATAGSKCIDDTSRTGTFSMDDFEYYIGKMYVEVDPNSGYVTCEKNATAKIIWGPWETKEYKLDKNNKFITKKIAITFNKNKPPDSTPLTVVVNGCKYQSMMYIKLCSGNPQRHDYAHVYDLYSWDWHRR